MTPWWRRRSPVGGRTESDGNAAYRLLPDGRISGPMPWVIAIMALLTVLALALGLTIVSGQARTGATLERLATVQILAADARARNIESDRAARRLAMLDAVVDIRVVPPDEVEALLAPWLGEDVANSGIPLPALVDVTLARPADPAMIATLQAELAEVAPSARIEAQGGWLAPVVRFGNTLIVVAAGLILLLGAALSAVVVLAVRASFDSNRATIEVMHHLGATDLQIARLFQRRLAIDALFGGLVGLGGGVTVLILHDRQLTDLGAQLLGGGGLDWPAWVAIGLVPLLIVALAVAVARITILRALGRIL